MIHSELVAHTTLDAKFHSFVEQLTGTNSATIVQRNRRPRSEHAYILSYFKAFHDPTSDTSDVKAFLGLVNFTILSAGPELDMFEVMGTPHGLQCLSCPVNRQGVVGVLFSGDGDQWAAAIRNALFGTTITQAWGMSCRQQFAKINLDDLMSGTNKPRIA